MIYEILLAIINDEQHREARRVTELYLSEDLADKLLMEIVRRGMPYQPFSQIGWQANYAIPDSHLGLMFHGKKDYKQIKVDIDDGAA